MTDGHRKRILTSETRQHIFRRRSLIALAISSAVLLTVGGVAYGAAAILGGTPRNASLGNASVIPTTAASPTTEPGSTTSSSPTTTSTSIPTSTSTTIGAPSITKPGGAAPGVAGFDAVTCVSTSFCLAVGADSNGAGIVSSSTDGGDTWSPSQVPSGTPELDGVACFGTENCVAVGSNTLINSDDGGLTWSTDSLPVQNTTLLGVSCTSPSLCVAVGVSPDPGGPYAGELLTSADGGISWSDASIPDGTLGMGSVACTSSTACIAVGAGILTTNDSGSAWQMGTVDGGSQALSSIACSSAQTCVAVGSNPAGIQDSSAAASAISSVDGAGTWNSEQFPQGTSGVDQVACSGDDCVAVGTDIAASASGGVELVTSTDGGQTWSPGTTPPGLTTASSVSCPAAGDCVVVGQSASGPAVATDQDGEWHVFSIATGTGARREKDVAWISSPTYPCRVAPLFPSNSPIESRQHRWPCTASIRGNFSPGRAVSWARSADRARRFSDTRSTNQWSRKLLYPI